MRGSLEAVSVPKRGSHASWLWIPQNEVRRKEIFLVHLRRARVGVIRFCQ
jgi:hypothetical protein